MKKAVVLYNLGGPDHLKNVESFLFNLFNDPAIIALPTFLRWPLAKIISKRRKSEASKIYKSLGGRSPILPQTEKQAEKLQRMLGDSCDVFVCMRYWHPMIPEIQKKLTNKGYSSVQLIPLYPQFSTTTNGSFVNEWVNQSSKTGYCIATKSICCYPKENGYIQAQAAVINDYIKKENVPENTIFLFSAHGLPEKIVQSGDPYPEHVNLTVKKVVELCPAIANHIVAYQSKVGPLKWIGPSTEEVIKKLSKDKQNIAVVPISFVSEHSETLYELDIEYRNEAVALGIKNFFRVPTLQDSDLYISFLKQLVEKNDVNSCGSKNCFAEKCEQKLKECLK